MIGRVNGVNFTGIYGGTRAMGWQTVRLPEGYTWKGFMQFLLSTLPEETRRNYLKKLTVSIEFWRTISILKNDHACKYMGFALNKEEAYKRDKIMEQFKNMML